MGINRTNASVFWEEQWEDWTHLTRKQLIRKSPPARLIITVFAAQRSTDPSVAPRETDQQFSEEPHATKRPRMNPCDDKEIADAEPNSSQSSQSLEPSVEKQSLVSKTQHGPKFMRLSSEQRQQLIRMHSNLGHPNVTLLGNVLRDQGWPMEAMEGLKDMHCPTCFEQSRPKIARPSHLSEPRQFNDLITMDGVQWTNSEGNQFTFYHILDSGTNFQVAFPFQHRPTSHEITQQMNRMWFSWAGPPKC
jgi:hypothetical protein